MYKLTNNKESNGELHENTKPITSVSRTIEPNKFDIFFSDDGCFTLIGEQEITMSEQKFNDFNVLVLSKFNTDARIKLTNVGEELAIVIVIVIVGR